MTAGPVVYGTVFGTDAGVWSVYWTYGASGLYAHGELQVAVGGVGIII